MQYMIVIHEHDTDFHKRSDPEQAEAYWGSWQAYSQALEAEVGILAGRALQHADTSTIVRVKDGQRVVEDGPYADSKELLSGFYVIDVPDLDVALAWAARCPAAVHGAVEVRPVLAMG